MEGNPKVTVIVPVYMAEAYLYSCVDSLLSQTMKDFEVLLIDDGSSDNSGKICDEYAGKDSRIRVFHKENGGVSSARNVGLDEARAEWITFVDSDDKVLPGYLLNMFCHIEVGVDLVVSYAKLIGESSYLEEQYPSRLITDANFDVMFYENKMSWHTSPWGKLYRSSIIQNNKIRFCKGMHIGEDALFLYTYMMNANKIFITSNTDYCYYYEHQGGLTKRINSLQSEMLSYKNIYDITTKLIKEKNIRDERALNELYWLRASYVRRVLNSLYYNQIDRKARLDVIANIDVDSYIKSMGKCSAKEQILKCLLILKCYRAYDIIRRLKRF